MDFAEALGIKQGYLSRIESGRETPSITIIEKICELYNEDFKEAKELLLKSKKAVTHSGNSLSETEMKDRVEFLEQQVQELMETNKRQTEMNMKLITLLEANNSARQEYMDEFSFLKESHEEHQKQLSLLFSMFQERQK